MTTLGLAVSYIALWVLVLCLTSAVYVLARHVGMLHVRTGNTSARVTKAGPEIGSVVLEIRATALDGRSIGIGGAKGRHMLLVFITPNCFNCSELAPAFRTIARTERRLIDLVLVGRGSESDNKTYIERNKLSGLVFICSDETHDLYGITLTPHAVLIAPDGRVAAKGLVNTAVHLESILNTIDASRHPTVGPPLSAVGAQDDAGVSAAGRD